MRGHIAKKGRRYYVVIYEGVDASTGKPKRRWHTAGETRAEAEKLLAELVKRVHDGDYRAPDKITVGDYLLHRWLPAKKTRLKPTTAGVYERNIRLHINPSIGHIPLQKLQPEDLDGLYAKLLCDGATARTADCRPGRCVRCTPPSKAPCLTRSARARWCAMSPIWPTRRPRGARNRP